ncbi:MAG TPA: hypothetical protein VGN89_00495, partial [Phenylobacterium sp.]|nr:hypothetical protein [Phenylobacterium sp.]
QGYSQGMRRLIYALIIATLCAAPARAQPMPALCKALHGLSDETRRSGEPQRISADVAFAAPAACRPVTGGAAARAFCDAAAQESGLAYRVLSCVANMAAGPQVTTRNEHAEGRGRDAITHLTGKVGGARLDLSETAGRYDIVVWAPK